MAVSSIFVCVNYVISMTNHVLFLIHIKNYALKIIHILLLCVDVLVECTKKKVVRGLLDLAHFSDTFYFLLAFYFRILFSYTTDFNPRINKDVTIILIDVVVIIIIITIINFVVVVVVVVIIIITIIIIIIIYIVIITLRSDVISWLKCHNSRQQTGKQLS